jgi:hypothetical protein
LAYNALSLEEKKRLLVAVEQDDGDAMDAIFGSGQSGRHLMNDEPTPEDLFGLLGIFPSFCDSKLGQRFGKKKCDEDDPPVAAPTGKGGSMASMGMMGKRRSRTRILKLDDEMKLDISTAFNALSPADKKRALKAVEDDNETELDSLFGRM